MTTESSQIRQRVTLVSSSGLKSQTRLEPTPYLPDRLAAVYHPSPSLSLTICKMGIIAVGTPTLQTPARYQGSCLLEVNKQSEH